MPIKTVKDLIDQLSNLKGDLIIGIGNRQQCAHIKDIHLTELFGWGVSEHGHRVSTIHECVVLEPFQKPDLPSEDEIKAKMASHRS